MRIYITTAVAEAKILPMFFMAEIFNEFSSLQNFMNDCVSMMY